MSDQTQSSVQTANGAKGPQSASGQLPFFSKTTHPSPFSVGDMNRIVKLLRAFQALTITRTEAEPNNDGSYTPSAKFTLSDTNALIELFDVPGDAASGGDGTANIVAMQVQGAPSGTNDYFSAKMYDFGSGASGSAINVSLPWELRHAQNPGTGYAISQPYVANDIIFALSTDAGQNGVTVSASELLWLDLGLGRTWRTVGSQDFTIVSISGDYITATNNATTTSTNIAKNFKLRNSITSATVDSVSYAYSYTSAVQRTAFASSISYTEYQRVSPRYLVGDVIWANQPTATGVTISGSPLVWMDENRDGRAWAARTDQTGP